MGLLAPSNSAPPTEVCGDKLWAAKVMYAVGAAGASAICNFLPVFYQNASFSKIQIGLLQTLPSICSMLGPPFWGAIADQFHVSREVHVFCMLSGAFLMYFVQYFQNYYTVIAIILVSNFQSTPTQSLLDLAVMDMITKYGGEYGKQRLFGAVGFGAGAYATGMLVASAGISYAFSLNVVSAVVSIFVLRLIPVMKTAPDAHLENAEKKEPAPSFMESMKMVMHQGDVFVLLFVVFLMGLMFGVLSSFLTLNMYNLSGGDARIIGVAIACETSSELPAFFFSDRIIKKLGTVNVLLISIGGYAARITYYGLMTNPWYAIPFEFLHGVTFGLAWAACTKYIYAASPRGCEGTMMGMLNAVQNGLGRGVGTIVGGFFYEHYGAPTMWFITDLGVPLSLLGVFVFAFLKKGTEELAHNHDESSELLQKAELFSPHSLTPKGSKANPSYDSVN